MNDAFEKPLLKFAVYMYTLLLAAAYPTGIRSWLRHPRVTPASPKHATKKIETPSRAGFKNKPTRADTWQHVYSWRANQGWLEQHYQQYHPHHQHHLLVDRVQPIQAIGSCH